MKLKSLVLLVACAFCASVSDAHPKQLSSADSTRPVSKQEAQAFSDRIARLQEHGDLHALKAYRADSQLVVMLSHQGKPTSMRLTGQPLQAFLRNNIQTIEDVKTASSCIYTARDDGQVQRACISVNANAPAPFYTVALVSRDKAGLNYPVTLVTDDLQIAQTISQGALATGSDEEDDSDIDDGPGDDAPEPATPLRDNQSPQRGAVFAI